MKAKLNQIRQIDKRTLVLITNLTILFLSILGLFSLSFNDNWLYNILCPTVLPFMIIVFYCLKILSSLFLVARHLYNSLCRSVCLSCQSECISQALLKIYSWNFWWRFPVPFSIVCRSGFKVHVSSRVGPDIRHYKSAGYLKMCWISGNFHHPAGYRISGIRNKPDIWKFDGHRTIFNIWPDIRHYKSARYPVSSQTGYPAQP